MLTFSRPWGFATRRMARPAFGVDSRRPVFVVGNEAADVDSLVSASLGPRSTQGSITFQKASLWTGRVPQLVEFLWPVASLLQERNAVCEADTSALLRGAHARAKYFSHNASGNHSVPIDETK